MSDCLSRLEDGEKTGFDEKIVLDVAGLMFGGESISKSPYPCFFFCL